MYYIRYVKCLLSSVCRHNGFRVITLCLLNEPSEFLRQRYLAQNKGFDWGIVVLLDSKQDASWIMIFSGLSAYKAIIYLMQNYFFQI